MRKQTLMLAVVVTILVVAGFRLRGDESTDSWKLPPETARFKSAPETALVTGNCMVCHSADYIATQPPLNRKQWTALVTKMQTKFGAPLMTNKLDEIVNYLVKNYGRD